MGGAIGLWPPWRHARCRATTSRAIATPGTLPLHTPSAAQPPALTVASEGTWEHKPVAVLAIELTWPGPTEPEALGRRALAGDRRLAAHHHGAGAGVRRGRPAALAVAASGSLWYAPNARAVAAAGGAGGFWRSGSGSWRPRRRALSLRCAWWGIGDRCWSMCRRPIPRRNSRPWGRRWRGRCGCWGRPPRGDSGVPGTRRAGRGLVRAGSA